MGEYIAKEGDDTGDVSTFSENSEDKQRHEYRQMFIKDILNERKYLQLHLVYNLSFKLSIETNIFTRD